MIIFQTFVEWIAILYFFTWFIWPALCVVAFSEIVKYSQSDCKLTSEQSKEKAKRLRNWKITAIVSATIIFAGITATLSRLLMAQGAFYTHITM
jgi:late competence protein required for DNA uptake (superfamily II DNA/RNA helicase)